MLRNANVARHIHHDEANSCRYDALSCSRFRHSWQA